MALIYCPECGKEVSDSARKCPHCGYSLKRIPKKKIIIAIASVVVLFAAIFGVTKIVNYKKELKAAQEATAQALIAHDLKVATIRMKKNTESAIEQVYTDIKRSLDLDITSFSNRVVGKITNNSDYTVNFVEVSISFYDDGNKIDAATTYAVGKESLRPGESQEFEVYHKYSYYEKRAEILDFNIQ